MESNKQRINRQEEIINELNYKLMEEETIHEQITTELEMKIVEL